MRSRALVFVAHCLLNQNAVPVGREVAPGAIKELLELFAEAGVGIVQLPCPQLEFNGGLDRKPGSNHDAPDYRVYCRLLARAIVKQIERWHNRGYRVFGVLGIEGSANCGVWRTSNNGRIVPGQGVLIKQLATELAERWLAVPLLGANVNNIWHTLEQLRNLLAPQAVICSR